MLAIALLTVITVSSQTPPDVPPPLDEGEMTYIIELTDGEVMYGRAMPRDVNRSKGEGKFWIDEPDPAINNRQTYQFKSCTEEFDGRNERWKKMVAEWHAAAGNVQTTFADGSLGWVKQADAEYSERARNAARNIIQQRKANETIAAEAPTPTSVKTDEDPKPGFLELWGPQAAVGLLGLVLMGLVARTLVFNGESDWQKIE